MDVKRGGRGRSVNGLDFPDHDQIEDGRTVNIDSVNICVLCRSCKERRRCGGWRMDVQKVWRMEAACVKDVEDGGRK